jgi:threonine dehydrogenase-like Zn-dependent dehydrogenase
VGEGGDVTLDVSRDMLRKQLTLVGSWTFSAMGMGECARFIADNGIVLERIFTHRWKLDQADQAYRKFDEQSSGKGVIEF